MCATVKVFGKFCAGLHDLRGAIGRDPVIHADCLGPDGRFDRAEDVCLCVVDHAATAALLGMEVGFDDDASLAYLPKPTVAGERTMSGESAILRAMHRMTSRPHCWTSDRDEAARPRVQWAINQGRGCGNATDPAWWGVHLDHTPGCAGCARAAWSLAERAGAGHAGV